MTQYHCANCEFETDDYHSIHPLENATDLGERLDPGSVVPAGECPKCGCFVYKDSEQLPEHTPRIVLVQSGGNLSIKEAPAGAVVHLHDYDCPEDWEGLETDADGDKYQLIVLQSKQ